jgi:hypothetical protein
MDEDVAIPVTVVVVGDDADVRSGVLRRMDQNTVRLWVPEPLAVDARVVLAVGERTTLSGRVLATDGDLHVLSRDAGRAPDDRAAPRVRGLADARWRIGDDPQDRWLKGGPDGGAFVTHRGGVEISVSGMLFAVGGAVPHGTHLLLEVTLEGQSPWRAHGIVRRVDTAGQVAIEFLRLSESAFDALSEFTLERVTLD